MRLVTPAHARIRINCSVRAYYIQYYNTNIFFDVSLSSLLLRFSGKFVIIIRAARIIIVSVLMRYSGILNVLNIVLNAFGEKTNSNCTICSSSL